mgnify:CR=1 FL=1
MRVDEGRRRFENLAARTFEQPLVDAVQPTDFLVLGGEQLRPVVRAFLDRPAEPGGIVRPGAIFARLHQQFLRHAADVDAGAAPETLLGDGDAGAMAGGDAAEADAAGTAAAMVDSAAFPNGL